MARNQTLLIGVAATLLLAAFLVFQFGSDQPAPIRELKPTPTAQLEKPAAVALPLPDLEEVQERADSGATERAAVASELHTLPVHVLDRANDLLLANVPLALKRAANERVLTLNTDAQGRALFADLPAGEYTLEAASRGLLDYRAEPIQITIGDATTEEVQLRVERRWFLAGTAVEVGTNTPVPDVGLLLGNQAGKRSHLDVTNHAGQFRSKKSYAAGAITLYLAQQETACLTRTTDDGPELLHLVLGEDDVTNLVVELTWIGVLRGVVVDQANRPIEGALVRVMTSDSIYLRAASLRYWALYGGSDGEGRTARSDQEGRFSLARLPNDRNLVLVAYASGFASGRSPDVSPPFLGTDAPVELQLVEGGSIAGKVLDQSGEPKSDVTITALSLDTDYQPDPTRSGKDGSFLLTGLKPGPTEVGAREHQGGGQMKPIASGNVVVVAGERSELSLTAGTDGVHISGIAVDQFGEVITSDRMALKLRTQPLEPMAGESAWGSDSALAADGTFHVTVPRVGGYRLTLLGMIVGDRWQNQEVQAPVQDVRLTFTIVPTSELTIRALDAASGEKLNKGNVTISWDRGSIGGNFSGGEHISQVREGRYSLSVGVKGYAPVYRELDLTDHIDPTTLIEVRLERGRDITGIVRDTSGKPVKGCTLVLRISGMLQTEHMTYSGADGRFTMQAVPLSGGEVCVIDESYRTLASAEIGVGELVLEISGN